MLGIKVSVPIASFRKGMARQYLETYELPPPSTCYGFLLSLVGETKRESHCGARVAPAVLHAGEVGVVLRTMWRIKTASNHPGCGNNKTPDYQQLLTNTELLIWLDSSDETPTDGRDTLEVRVNRALDPKTRGAVERFGGLSLGESVHLVNDVSIFSVVPCPALRQKIFLLAEDGLMTLPVWVDHVGSDKTRYATGDLLDWATCEAPSCERMPQIVSGV
ncbi:MAG: type I-MYXAN CRISPR-associated protein Cas5/Cmx5/DevS [Thermoguttaceae bacterium]